MRGFLLALDHGHTFVLDQWLTDATEDVTMRDYEQIHKTTKMQFWFIADTVRLDAGLKPLSSSEANDMYARMRDRAVREQLKAS